MVKNMLKTLRTQSSKRGLWLLLTVIALALDGVALYLQHVLQVEPCNECIYVRTGVLGIAVAGLIGALAPRYLAMRLIGLVACLLIRPDEVSSRILHMPILKVADHPLRVLLQHRHVLVGRLA